MTLDHVWIINGIPGSGKSSVARRLAATFPRAAHIEGDLLHSMIHSGRVLPGQDPPEEAEAQIQLCVQHQCLLAHSFAHAGFLPILDYVIVNRARLDDYRRRLPGLALRLVTLTPDPAIALERDHLRPEKTVAPAWVHLDTLLRQNLIGIGLTLDNGPLTLDETVAALLRQPDRAAVVE